MGGRQWQQAEPNHLCTQKIGLLLSFTSVHFSFAWDAAMQHNRETKEFQEGRTLKKLCSKRSKKTEDFFFLIKSFYPFSYINPCKHWRYVWCQSWQPLVSPKHAERRKHSCSKATLPPARQVNLQVCAPAAIARPAPSSTGPKQSSGAALWVVHLRQKLLQGDVSCCHNGGKRDGRKAHGWEHSILAPFNALAELNGTEDKATGL